MRTPSVRLYPLEVRTKHLSPRRVFRAIRQQVRGRRKNSITEKLPFTGKQGSASERLARHLYGPGTAMRSDRRQPFSHRRAAFRIVNAISAKNGTGSLMTNT